jgi:hypothetical protein
VYTLAPGGAVERCEYRDFESCRLEVIGGNRGFCRQNYYAVQPETRRSRSRNR